MARRWVEGGKNLRDCACDMDGLLSGRRWEVAHDFGGKKARLFVLIWMYCCMERELLAGTRPGNSC